MPNIVKAYGSYILRFRRYDGDWSVKRLNTQTHSKELAEKILEEIEAVPIKDRTKARTDLIAANLLGKDQDEKRRKSMHAAWLRGERID